MAIILRSVKGSNLTAAEVDGNFTTLEAMNNAKADQGVGIAAVTLVPNNMLQFQLTDHSYLPPVGPLPSAQYRFRGNWTPSTAYLVNDTFNESGNGYAVLVQHTSATTFDANATDGGGHNLYGLYFATASSIPAGGDDGAVLTKHSSADFDMIWSLPTGGLSGGVVVEGPVDLLAQTVTQSGGSIAINRALGEVVRVSLTANVTAITVTNWPASGNLGKITLLATNGGAFTSRGWPSGTITPRGTAPTLTSGSGKKDVFVLMSPDGGTTIYGSIAGQNYS